MGDNQHGQTAFRQLADDGEYFANHRRVKRRGGFVEENDFRVHGKRTGDGYALFLSAGEGGRIDIGFLRHAYFLEQLHRFLLGLRLGQFQQLHRGVGDVLQHGHVLEEVEGLEDHAHLTAQAVQRIAGRGDVLAVDDDLARGGRFEHVDGPEKRTLAGA